jgi:hypothetical protein
MESDRFDALTARLAAPHSRRRSVGLLGLLGLGSAAALNEADAKKRKKKKKKKKGNKRKTTTTTLAPVCRHQCATRECGDDGCGGSCGECPGELVCRNGTCGCPEGMDLCGGTCHPACPPSNGSRTVVRHPATCTCCVRPGGIPCPDSIYACCYPPEEEPGSDILPCCAAPCEPLLADPYCLEWQDTSADLPTYCRYDVECYEGRRCAENEEPRACVTIPG